MNRNSISELIGYGVGRTLKAEIIEQFPLDLSKSKLRIGNGLFRDFFFFEVKLQLRTELHIKTIYLNNK
jgi:hypothetical protein